MSDRRNTVSKALFNPLNNEAVGAEARYLLSNSALVPDPSAVFCGGVLVYGSRPESGFRAGGGARTFVSIQNSAGTTIFRINQSTTNVNVLYGATAVGVTGFSARQQGRLVHLWATRQSDGLRIYQNGVLISGPTAAAAVATAGDDIAINGEPAASTSTPMGYDIVAVYISEDSAPDSAGGIGAAAWHTQLQADIEQGRGLFRLWRTPVALSDYGWDASDIVKGGAGPTELTWTDRFSALALVRQSATQPIGGHAVNRF